MADAVVRYSARNPGASFVMDKENSMTVPVIDWKWDDKVKEPLPFIAGEQDLQEITNSYKDIGSVKGILAKVAQGDMSVIHNKPNLGDITEFPTNAHELEHMVADAEAKAAALTDLGIVGKDGSVLSGVELSKLEGDELKTIISAYIAGKQQAAQEGVKANDSVSE